MDIQTKALRQQADEFERLSNEDVLTGLANRRAFDKALRRHLENDHGTQALSVAILDIDHFKRINDTYSHLVGDKVIKAVAKTLQNADGIEFSARWGGEEFACLVYGDNHSVFRLFDLLRMAISQTVIPAGKDNLKVTVSIGIANAAQTHDYAELLQFADKALYQAKKGGRNTVVVSGVSKPLHFDELS